MRLVVLAAAGCLGLVAPAAAQDSSGAAPAAPAAKEKKICRNSVNTGSIMKTRICHTQAEWKEIEQRNARSNEQFRDRLDRGSIGTTGG